MSRIYLGLCLNAIAVLCGGYVLIGLRHEVGRTLAGWLYYSQIPLVIANGLFAVWHAVTIIVARGRP